MKLLHRLLREESGQGMAEYGLILALIAIAAVVAVSGLGDKIKAIFEDLTTKFDNPGS